MIWLLIAGRSLDDLRTRPAVLAPDHRRVPRGGASVAVRSGGLGVRLGGRLIGVAVAVVIREALGIVVAAMLALRLGAGGRDRLRLYRCKGDGCAEAGSRRLRAHDRGGRFRLAQRPSPGSPGTAQAVRPARRA